jgi:predicted ATPase
MVNRKVELNRLMQDWKKATEGHGQVVTLVGSAGIGKSRLLHEFRRRIARTEHVWIEGAGAQFFANTPFYVVSQLIRRMLDQSGRLSPSELQEQLERPVREAGLETATVLPLLTDAVGDTAGGAPASMSSEDRRRLLSAVTKWIVSGARDTPLIMVIEDLHWTDPSSLELAGRVIKKLGTMRILMLLTLRSGYMPALTMWGRDTEFLLHPLNDDELRQIISEASSRGSSLPERDIKRIVKRAEGVPLFGIELARLVDAREGAGRGYEIPATLADLLAARLDQVGGAKPVAQMAAVIGDATSMALLEAVSRISGKRLAAQLITLQTHDILRAAGDNPDADYEFTHALLRDAAYGSLLREERRKIHRRVARVLSRNFVELATRRPELVAHHWTAAADWKAAWAAWQQAGDLATTRRAFVEAEQGYRNALEALLALPYSAGRDATELAMQTALADVLRITRGFSAPQTKEATARAGVLIERHGDRSQQFLQMWANWTAASSGGDYRAASDVADRFQRLANLDGSPINLAYAHMIRMTSKYRVGQLIDAEEEFKRGEPFFRTTAFEARPGVIAQTYGNAALMAWMLRDDDVSRQRIDHALAIAVRNDNPFDRAYAEYMASNYAVLTDKFEWAAELAESSIALSDKHNFPQFSAISRVALGRARVGLGKIDEGIELMRLGMSRMADASVRVSITVYWAWLAEAHCLLHDYQQALRDLDEAETVNPQEMFFRPEIARLRGEVSACCGQVGEAESALREAIALANQMSATRFGERAAKSLQRLLDTHS